jgi:DNA/RNA endonuclease G (NUC1)
MLHAQFFGGTQPTSSHKIERFDYAYFSVGYSNEARAPLWSAMEAQNAHGPILGCRRPAHFATEPRADPPITHKDFANTEGYSRGHMTPSAVMAYTYGCEAASTTFITSNVVPQLQKHNAGVWEGLEAAVGGTASRNGFKEGLVQKAAAVWIYTGPVFWEHPSLEATLGPKQIHIPSAFWKTVLWKDAQGKIRTCSWIIPHEEGIRKKDFMNFVCNIEAIHQRTGINVLGTISSALYKESDWSEFEETIE